MKLFGLEIRKAGKDDNFTLLDTERWTSLFRYSPRMSVSDLMANSTVNACVNIISDAVAVLPLNLYKRLKDGSRERADKEDLYRIFKEKANFYQMPFTFKKQVMTHLLLKGNAFIFIEREGSKVTGVYALEPDRVDIKKHPDKNAYYYEYRDSEGKTWKYTSDDIIHIPAMVWNGVRGLSPIEYASRVPSLGNTLDSYTENIFDGGIHSKLLMTVPKDEKNWTKEDTKALENRIISEYGGAENAHKPLIVSKGLTVEALNLSSNEEAQLIQNRTYTVKEIAKIFRVPLSMLGESDAKYNNNEQQQRNFLNGTLAPWLVILQEHLSLLLPYFDRGAYYFEFDTNAMTRADSTQRIANYERELSNGMLSLNDINRMENRPLLPSEIGDVRFMPVNRMPLTKENIDAYMAAQKQKISGKSDKGGDDTEESG